MTSRTGFAPSERRGRVERRQGGDSRSPAQRMLQGERRGGGDRRAAKTHDGANAGRMQWLYLFLLATLLCYLDVQHYAGAHSTRVAVELGKGANALAHRWIYGAF